MYNIFIITIISLLFLLFLAVIGTKKSLNTINKDIFLSKSQTDWLKGLSIIMIVLSHYYPILGISEIGSFWMLGCIAFLGVALFLFLSGYGAMYSKLHKPNYLKGYLKKRFFRLYIPFIIVFLLDIVILFVTNQSITFYDFAKIPIMSLPGTPNWYLKVQMCLYILFFILSKIIHNNKKMIITLFFLCTTYMIVGLLFGIEYYWYESSYMFPLGMCFAVYKDKIFNILAKKYIVTFVVSGLCLVFSFIPYYLYGGVIPEIFFIAGMVQFVITICVKTQGTFKFTSWLGTISLELYLVHSAVLHSFIGYFDHKESIISFFVFIFSSIFISYIVKKFCDILFLKNRIN